MSEKLKVRKVIARGVVEDGHMHTASGDVFWLSDVKGKEVEIVEWVEPEKKMVQPKDMRWIPSDGYEGEILTTAGRHVATAFSNGDCRVGKNYHSEKGDIKSAKTAIIKHLTDKKLCGFGREEDPKYVFYEVTWVTPQGDYDAITFGRNSSDPCLKVARRRAEEMFADFVKHKEQYKTIWLYGVLADTTRVELDRYDGEAKSESLKI